MKRSSVNQIIRESDRFIRSFGYIMPPFAYWSPDELKKRRPPGIVSARLGWNEQIGNHMVCKTKISDEVFCAAEKGDVIVFSSLMLHHTKKNNSNSDRWAYVVEYMSLDHYDPLVPPPFFVVAENGVRNPRWVSSYRGHANLRNRLKYVGLSLEDRAKGLLNKS